MLMMLVELRAAMSSLVSMVGRWERDAERKSS